RPDPVTGRYPKYIYPPGWKEGRAAAARQAAEADQQLTSATAADIWKRALPQLYGEVELDLSQHHLITDLDRALDTRTWHFVRSAVTRLMDIDASWLRRTVMTDVRRRSTGIQHPRSRGAGL